MSRQAHGGRSIASRKLAKLLHCLGLQVRSCHHVDMSRRNERCNPANRVLEERMRPLKGEKLFWQGGPTFRPKPGTTSAGENNRVRVHVLCSLLYWSLYRARMIAC
jgi:hypothetical protein